MFCKEVFFYWSSGILFLWMGGWVWKMRLMLTQLPTQLELKLKLSLAISNQMLQVVGAAFKIEVIKIEVIKIEDIKFNDLI